MPEFGGHSALTGLAHAGKGPVKVIVQVVVDSDDGTPATIREVFRFEPAPLAPDSLGLKLSQAKDVLAAVQAATVDEQARASKGRAAGVIYERMSVLYGAVVASTDDEMSGLLPMQQCR